MANFDVIAILKANISDFKSGMKEAEGTLKNFKQASGSTFQNIGNAVSGFGTALTIGVTAPLVAAGTQAYLFAADMEDALGATEQIFGSAASEVKSWADNLESYYGIAEAEALEYSNTMGAMLKNIGGLSEQEAAKTSAKLVELAGDLTAMFGGTTESAIQALTGALKGNNSMLDNYGMGVNEATIKLKAMEMGLIETGVSAAENERLMLGVEKAQAKYNEAVRKYGSESIEARDASNKLALANEKVEQATKDATGELTLQQKQAATLALIMEQTADAQGQAAREADGASGSMRGLMTELKNLSTELGQVLLPIITPFIAKLRDLVGKFKGLSDEQKQNIVKWAGIAAAVGPVLFVFGKFITALPGLINGFSTLGMLIAKLAPAFTFLQKGVMSLFGILKTVGTFIGSGLMMVIKALTTVISSGLTLAVKALGAALAFLTSPIGLAITAIVAITGIVVYLWKTNEGFRNAVITAWENIKSGAQQLATNIATWFGNMVNTVIQTGTNIVNSVKQTWTNVTTSIGNAVGQAKAAASSVMQGVLDTVTGWFDSFASAGANIVGMIADGIMGAVGKVTSAIGNVTSKIRAYLPFSPAKEGALRDIHRLNFGGTIADSIKRDSFKPIQAVSDLTKGIRSTWSNDVGRLQANVGGSVKRDIQTSVNVQNSGANSLLAQLLNREQYLVLDTGALVGHTQHAYDVANGKSINLGKRVRR